jgi:hypothetical protein
LKEAKSSEAASRAKRKATLSTLISPPCAQWISLEQEEKIVTWHWPTNRLYFAHTIRAEGIEVHAVLFHYQMPGKLVLEQDEIMPAQKTFKERILRPLSKPQEHFMNFGASLVVGNIISNHITRHHYRSPSS